MNSNSNFKSQFAYLGMKEAQSDRLKKIWTEVLLNESNSNQVEQMGLEFDLITEDQKAFVEDYCIRLKREQTTMEENKILYTKISMQYAVQAGLCFLELLFHPQCLTTRKYFEREYQNNVMATLEEVIVWETTQEKTLLSRVQLETTIKHFRSLELSYQENKDTGVS